MLSWNRKLKFHWIKYMNVVRNRKDGFMIKWHSHFTTLSSSSCFSIISLIRFLSIFFDPILSILKLFSHIFFESSVLVSVWFVVIFSPNHLFLVSSFVQNFCSWHIIFHVWLLIFYGFYFHFRFLKINSTLSGFYLLIYSCFPIYIQNYVVMNFPFLPFSLFLS